MTHKKLDFQYGYEVQEVSPLSHYYEEIIAHKKRFKEIGLRGDKNYLFYSKDNAGTAYYEKHEADLSAQQTYGYFSDKQNRKIFFSNIEKLLKKIDKKISDLEELNLKDIDDNKLYSLSIELMDLDGWAFTYFLATQPHRTKYFEDEVRSELRKRVATTRVDSYLTTLALSEKPTKMSKEEMEWLSLIINFRAKIPPAKLDIKKLKNKHPDFYKAIATHYEKYKIITLGDGSWHPTIDYFIDNLSRDYQRPLKTLRTRYVELKNFEKETLKQRNELIRTLYLDNKTIKTIEFLADLGHYRFILRTNGWMPLIHSSVSIGAEIDKRLEITGPEILYLIDDKELMEFYSNPNQEKIDALKKRVSKNKEYVMMLKEGEYSCYFGEEAQKIFKKYVKTVNVTNYTEIEGNVAMKGKITGTATVYKWGDDMKVKMKEIKKHPILIAGHTRPAMMPLIRESKGIVTDEGGVTSHAAIVSRELGLPSVINTKFATKIFQTGDNVELDAENGVVRKLS